jgi:hypothetical protein
MPFVDVLFSDFVPDRGGAPWPEDPAYLVDAVAVRPTGNGWRVHADATLVASTATVGPGTTTQTSPVSAYHCGDTIAQDFFAGSDTKLFQSDDLGATWNDVSRSTAYSSGNDWDWAQFNNLIFAAHGVSTPVQRKEITTTTAVLFTDLGGGSPSSCKTVARVRDHLVLGHLEETAGVTSRTVQWSSIGDPEDYPTPGSATARARQSGSRVMPYEQGLVQKVVGGEKFGIVMQESGLSRMTYIGGDVVYQFDNFSPKIGLDESRVRSVIQVGGVVYFVNSSGLFGTDGAELQKLSDGVLDDALIQGNLSHPNATVGAGVSAAHDARNGNILIATNGGLVLGYNYWRSKFFIQSEAAESVIFDGIGGVNDATPKVYEFVSRRLNQLTAAPSGVGIQTGYIELVPGMRVRLLAAHILGAQTTTPTIGYKGVDTPNSADVLQTGFTSLTAAPRGIKQTGRGEARFFSFRVTGAQGLAALLKGLRVYYEPVSEE